MPIKIAGASNNQSSLLLSFFQHSSTLPMMRALISQATVRASLLALRDDPCLNTVSYNLRFNDLSLSSKYLMTKIQDTRFNVQRSRSPPPSSSPATRGRKEVGV